MASIKISNLQSAMQEDELIFLKEQQLNNIQGGGASDVIIVYDYETVIIPDNGPNVVVDRTTKK